MLSVSATIHVMPNPVTNKSFFVHCVDDLFGVASDKERFMVLEMFKNLFLCDFAVGISVHDQYPAHALSAAKDLVQMIVSS